VCTLLPTPEPFVPWVVGFVEYARWAIQLSIVGLLKKVTVVSISDQ